MKLSKKAIKAINYQEIRLRLALELGCSENWIIKLIKRNTVNNLLTTAAAIQVIKANTKLKDSEIFEAEKKAFA